MSYEEGGDENAGKDMSKKYLGQNRRATMGRNQQNYYKYMDIMATSLNKNIQ